MERTTHMSIIFVKTTLSQKGVDIHCVTLQIAFWEYARPRMDIIVFAPRDKNIVLNVTSLLAFLHQIFGGACTSWSHKRDRTTPTWPFVHRLCKYHGASETDRLALESNATSPLRMNLS